MLEFYTKMLFVVYQNLSRTFRAHDLRISLSHAISRRSCVAGPTSTSRMPRFQQRVTHRSRRSCVAGWTSNFIIARIPTTRDHIGFPPYLSRTCPNLAVKFPHKSPIRHRHHGPLLPMTHFYLRKKRGDGRTTPAKPIYRPLRRPDFATAPRGCDLIYRLQFFRREWG